MAFVIKNLPANTGDIQKMWVPSLGQEDPLEEGMATNSHILTWRIPWTSHRQRSLVGYIHEVAESEPTEGT